MPMLLVAAVVAGIASPLPAKAQGQTGYVDTTALNLRAGAGTGSAIVGILLKYDTVTVAGTQRVGETSWYAIEAGGGYTNGYVAARFIQFGDPPTGAVEEEILDYGPRETPTLERGRFKYVGPGVCAECHEDSTGDYSKGASTVWAHTVHSTAHQTLSRDYTKVIAQRKRDIQDPANDWRCIKCHVTAFGAAKEQLAPTYRDEDGVGCEACHGPGSEYAQEDHGPDSPNRANMGFQKLTNLTERREVCTSCHNPRSPTYKPFNLREFSRSIAHWVDPGDEFYYEDAIAEANRRQERVDQALGLAASKVASANAAEDAARAAREAAQRSEREEAAKAANAEERARLQAEQAEADRLAQEAADRELAEREAARKKLAADAKQRQEAERRAAEAALAADAATEASREAEADAARKAAERQALAEASNATGVESFLEDVDEVITLNTNGEKYNSVEFPHLAHASKRYLPNGACNDCHHTHEGDDESPEACSTCHGIDGEAEEDRAKTRAVHAKNKGFPREADQEQTSCVGCHKSLNAAVEAGTRQGEKGPTKCTSCHSRKR